MLGNMEELISIAENDILPILKDYVTKVKKHSYLEFDVIYSGWLEANMTLAGAYILQGSGKGISLLTEMSELLKINKLESRYSLTRINIDLALGYTMQGFIKKSQKTQSPNIPGIIPQPISSVFQLSASVQPCGKIQFHDSPYTSGFL